MGLRLPWAALARLGQAHWFAGNAYEAAVDMPALLADARPNREPRLLGPGSPLRYYAPAAPVTLVSTGVTLVSGWRSGADRRAVAVSVVGTLVAAALTGYLVKAVNLRLLRGEEPLGDDERRRLVRTWHRANLVRLAALAVTAAATRRVTAR